jgi:hypothetical protein
MKMNVHTLGVVGVKNIAHHSSSLNWLRWYSASPQQHIYSETTKKKPGKNKQKCSYWSGYSKGFSNSISELGTKSKHNFILVSLVFELRALCTLSRCSYCSTTSAIHPTRFVIDFSEIWCHKLYSRGWFSTIILLISDSEYLGLQA